MQRAFAVHHFIVRQRQDEIFGEAEYSMRKVSMVVVILAMDGIVLRNSFSVSCIQPMSHFMPKPSPPT